VSSPAATFNSFRFGEVRETTRGAFIFCFYVLVGFSFG